jgi:D-sedoheptulose 7-phosphate isomerase
MMFIILYSDSETQRIGCAGNSIRGDFVDKKRIDELITESAATVASLSYHTDAIAQICEMICDVLKRGGKVLTAGNGGSAADALHMSEELVGRYRGDRQSLPAVALVADCTALTCIGNDYGFDEIFSRQIEGLGREGDMLVLFSTSGGAANLKRGMDVGLSRGLKVVSFLGRDGGKLAGLGAAEVIIESTATERIQEAHQVLVHLLLEAVELEFLGADQ